MLIALATVRAAMAGAVLARDGFGKAVDWCVHVICEANPTEWLHDVCVCA